MKLLTELLDNTVKLEEEIQVIGESSLKRHFLCGTYMQAEVVNRNKRIYPLSVLEGEIGRFIKENITNNSAFGELNHPQGPGINGDRICMLIKELRKDGTDFYGKSLIATTPMGEIVKGLLGDGARLGVSSRALGSLKQNHEGVNEVQNDLRILAVDVVTDPSGPSCYVQGILEGRDWVYDPVSGNYTEQNSHELQSHIEQVVEMHKEELQLKPAKTFDEVKLFLMMEQYLNSLVYTTKKKIEIKEDKVNDDLIKLFLPSDKYHLIKH